MNEPKSALGIPVLRRVAGGTIIIGGYFLAAVGFVKPQIYSFMRPGSSLHVPEVSRMVAIMMPAVVIYLTPYILFPCLFDRFPGWLVRRTKFDRLRIIAKGIFGVDIHP